LLFHQMGAYRFDEASVTAVILMLLSVSLFWLIDRSVGR
jgi:thiamine transport system permease protein